MSPMRMLSMAFSVSGAALTIIVLTPCATRNVSMDSDGANRAPSVHNSGIWRAIPCSPARSMLKPPTPAEAVSKIGKLAVMRPSMGGAMMAGAPVWAKPDLMTRGVEPDTPEVEAKPMMTGLPASDAAKIASESGSVLASSFAGNVPVKDGSCITRRGDNRSGSGNTISKATAAAPMPVS